MTVITFYFFSVYDLEQLTQENFYITTDNQYHKEVHTNGLIALYKLKD